jgi:hypothetical protein
MLRSLTKHTVFLAVIMSNSAQSSDQDVVDPSAADVNGFKEQFCIMEPHDAICSIIPNDQVDFSSSFEYMIVSNGAQRPFDFFSWQAFVALNWPIDESGRPREKFNSAMAENENYQWSKFSRRDQVMHRDKIASNCDPSLSSATVLTSDITQADGSVLIDHRGNFTIYETRMNAVLQNYIEENNLDSMAGQTAFENQTISFPKGTEGIVRNAPSISLKTSWRVLTDQDNQADFLATQGVVYIPEKHSFDQNEMCIKMTLGMVGMHIVSRVASGNGDQWLWSTFEHRDNVPIAQNARDINSIYARDLFPNGCTPPLEPSETYSYFDPECPDCQTNLDAGSDWSWAAFPPFARINGKPVKHGTQVVRCWKIFGETQRINTVWQQRLHGTGLENYMLISTQWRGANKSPLFEHGEVPRFVTNTTMETFLQSDNLGTCLGCHADANTATGQSANFSFILQEMD